MQRDERGDAELIVAVRGGDIAAFDVLYSRHRGQARSFARMLTASSPIDADDLVGDAFLKVLSALTKGHGPTGAFRPYLLATIRSTFVDESRYRSKVRATEDLEGCLPEIRGADPAGMEDRSYAAAAFTALPERWRDVLWQLDVEGEPPRTIAARLGVSAGAVSSLATRAREGLRRGYLQAHLRRHQESPVECDYVLTRLAGWTRTKPASRADDRIGRHLRTCASCRSVAADLREVNSSIGALTVPATLGAAAMTYLLAGTAAASGGSLAAGGAWLAATKAKVAATAVTWLTALGVLAVSPVSPAQLPVGAPVHQQSTSAAPTVAARPGVPGSPGGVDPGRPADQADPGDRPAPGDPRDGGRPGRFEHGPVHLGGVLGDPGALVHPSPPGHRPAGLPDVHSRLPRPGIPVPDRPSPPLHATRPVPPLPAPLPPPRAPRRPGAPSTAVPPTTPTSSVQPPTVRPRTVPASTGWTSTTRTQTGATSTVRTQTLRTCQPGPVDRQDPVSAFTIW